MTGRLRWFFDPGMSGWEGIVFLNTFTINVLSDVLMNGVLCRSGREGKKLDEAAMGNVLILELFFSHAVKGLYSMELYD
ncbi:MAG: hypothetical protein KHX31_13675 [Akkermansia sp.]|uniref:hypothetical protein n=1 Tax=Akkermansia sp. TaxID=1872421 RepID=UPI0025C343F9|nr:hypothetical protein [Akkermansia sp.]MBS5509669.1 hypothetical protein [Akkermansia sp.]